MRALSRVLFCLGAIALLDCSGAVEPVQEAPVVKSLEERRLAVAAELQAMIESSAAEGGYNCCIKDPCVHCVRLTGHCGCAEGLKRGEPVCDECAYMWTRGQGSIPGIDPKDVRSFLEASRPEDPEAGCDCGKPEPTAQ
jgi:hypothetical protein